jgi:hypothetical protein
VSGNPFAVLDDHDTGRDRWRLPTFVVGTERVRLEPGERALQVIDDCHIAVSSRALPRGTWQEVWHSPKSGTVTVTDRRVVFGCRAFEQGSLYGGFGVLGLVAGLVMTAVSRSRARARSAGHCFGGHARYEWLSAVSFTHYGNVPSPAGNLPVGRIHLDLVDVDRWWRFSLTALHQPGTTALVAETIVTDGVSRRDVHLERAVDLRPAVNATATVQLPGAQPISSSRPRRDTSRVIRRPGD